MTDEIVANFENAPFLSAVRSAAEGDIIPEKYADLTVVKIFGPEGGEYEERLEPTVLFRERFGEGVLLRKANSKAFIFVPVSVL